MRLLKEHDYKTFENLCGTSQTGLKNTMSRYLKSKYKHVIETKEYICAEGDIPIALVAHMDTVFKFPTHEIFYDRQKNVIWSPDGLGADDRAGVFTIIQIIKRGLRPHIILTTDEEIGAQGASALSSINCPFQDLRYLIQLDRRGSNDCVFYDCDNQSFVDYVEQFGFVEAIGSFSDISLICPAWKIAGVNLSIGYRDEHSTSEILFVNYMLDTMEKVIKMLQETEIPKFEYIPVKYDNRWFKWVHPRITADDKHCYICKKEYLPEELIPVLMNNGTQQYLCIDCIPGRADWCNCCGEAYETTDPKKNFGLCEDCLYDAYNKY